MKLDSIFANKTLIALGGFIMVGCTIAWDYLHGGVPTHYLLAQEDMPGFSNWWGVLTVPALIWITITLVEKRKSAKLKTDEKLNESVIWLNFLCALILGTVMSIFWVFDLEDILPYFLLAPLAISIFKPIHYAETLLGFVLGMLFVFGGVLPLIFGGVLLLISWVMNKVIGNGFKFILTSFKQK